MAKKPLFLALIAIATVAVVVPMILFGLPYGRFNPEAFAHLYTHGQSLNQTHLHIDAYPANGSRPCDPLDSEAVVEMGHTHSVAVCLETYAPNSVNNFELHIRYTGDPGATPPTTLNTAATEPYTGSPKSCPGGDTGCLDANPDANDGDDPTGFKLGDGWDCTGFTIAPPVGDDPTTLHVADAFIFCYADLVDPDQDLAADPGLLATISFTATGAGDDVIDFGDIDNTNKNIIFDPRLVDPGPPPVYGTARCGTKVPADLVGCFGATIHKVVFDCEFNDDFGRHTSLATYANGWQFTFPGGVANGTGRVVRMGSRVIVVGRGQGLSFLFGFGTCPSGPGTFYGLGGTGLLRLQDTTP
jgi:hypothetical protein